MEQKDQPMKIAAAVALSCIGVFGIFASPILVSALGATLGMTHEQTGSITAAEQLGTALATLAAIGWVRTFNWRRIALLAIVVVVAVNLLSAWQTDADSLTVLRFIAGFAGQGSAFAIAIAIINDSGNHDRNFAFAIAAQVAVGILTLLTLPPLAKLYGIGGVMWPLAGLALLVLPLIRWVPLHPRKKPAAAQGASESASVVPALVALAIILVWCTGLGGVWAFIIKIGDASAVLDATAAGRALAISTLAGVGGALAASWLADRLGRLIPVTVGLVVQIIALSLLRGDMSFVQFAATCAVFQIFWNFTGPYLMGTVAASDFTGRLSVAIPTAQLGGFAIGPVLAGRLMTENGLSAANFVGIAGCAFALLIFIPTAIRLGRRDLETA